MAMYTYECACGQVLEISHNIIEDPDIECNNCDGRMYRKIVPIGGVSFKGSGFYSKEK